MAGVIDRIRARFPSTGNRSPLSIPEGEVVSGRFPVLVHNAVRVNAYKPNVGGKDFGPVDLPMKRWTPPSIRPQMIIRTGPTPHPTGRTVPLGAVRKVVSR